MFKRNSIFSIVLLSIFITDYIYASCGRCSVDVAPDPKKSNSLITVVPESGNIEGLVIASCGMCNFGSKNARGCSLEIKIGDTIYPVEGSSVHDHGDAHNDEGLCTAVRIAYTRGKIKKGKLHTRNFVLLESPQ